MLQTLKQAQIYYILSIHKKPQCIMQIVSQHKIMLHNTKIQLLSHKLNLNLKQLCKITLIFNLNFFAV